MCKNMYKCRGKRHSCVALGNVCNNEPNCPLNDDEELCRLYATKCPAYCKCLIFAISCYKLQVFIFENMVFSYYTSVHVSHSKIHAIHNLKSLIQESHLIKLPKNNITIACPFYMEKAVYVNLEFNFIEVIDKDCFTKTGNIKVLVINNNNIKHLQTGAFRVLSALMFLNFSNNPTLYVQSNAFLYLRNLKILDIMNINFKDISISSFDKNLTILIFTRRYYVCCLIPQSSYCTKNPPTYVSCTDILPSNLLKSTYNFMSILTFLLNIFSIIVHLSGTQYKKNFTIIVTSVNGNGFLFVIYLSLLVVG